MNTLLISSSLNSFLLNSSPVFSTLLTLSINYSLNLLRVLSLGGTETTAGLSRHKKRALLVERSLESGVGAPVFNISLHHLRAEELSVSLLA